MGRQIQICITPSDNDSLRDYLLSKYDCTFFQSFAPSEAELMLDSFNNTYLQESTIQIYFKSFDWSPVIKQTSTKEQLYYIENTSTAPVIQFSKTDWETGHHGRLYWSKYFSGNPEYDVDKFELVYKDLVKWIKKNAGGCIKTSGITIYYLKEAWARHL